MTGTKLDKEKVKSLFSACVTIEVRLPNLDLSVGTGFHIGDGVFLTARHVLQGNTIVRVLGSSVDGSAVDGSLRTAFKISAGPYYHSNPEVDVAAFKLANVGASIPVFDLGGHYDDWLVDKDWLLTEGVVFGYPPIPTSRDAILVVDRIQINAVVDTYRDRYVRFVISGIPRGGFSGGPVYHEWGFVLGMVTESLEYMSEHSYTGYLTVLSIEALRECLDEHGILPECQRLD